MSRPIVLWRKKATISSDEACTTITSYSLPRYIPGLYESQESIEDTNLLVYVPSLQSLCIRQLIPFPDQIYTLGNVHLTYEPPQASGDYDLLRELVPGFSYAYNAKDAGFLQYLDPRLWAVLVQLYTGLPETFRVHKLPLSDIYLPLLQQIPSTDRFALVTTLNLRGCSEVDDDTILELRDLHGLGALDLGATAITSWGMHRLAKTLARKPDEQDAVRRLSGPWALRVITLRDCMNVKNDVYESLQQFPLLSVIDLRGTRCTPFSYHDTLFRLSADHKLYHPTPLIDILKELSRLSIPRDGYSNEPTLFSHMEPFFLQVQSLNHRPDRPMWAYRTTNIMDDSRLRPPRVTRDVFTGENLEGRVWTMPSSSQHPGAEPSSRMNELNEIAEVEALRNNGVAAALAFYRSHPDFLPSEDLPPDIHAIPASVQSRPLVGLTLYRIPPPWLVLDTLRDDGSQASRPARPAGKRTKFEIDEALMGATDFKRRGQATQAVQAIWGMVGRRKSAPEIGARSKPNVAEASGNPFLRKMEKSTFDDIAANEDLGAGAAHAATPGKPKTQLNDDASVKMDEDELTPQTSIFPLPPPTTKPLRPISTLAIPARPPELSKHVKGRATTSDATTPKSVASGKQMKLSVFAEKTAKRSQAPSQALPGSVKGFERSPVGSVSAGCDVERNAKTSKEAGKVVSGKRKRSEVRFDWKGWSTR